MPAVALVNGVAAAGGLELLLNCDFALAARSARIGDAHLNFGQMGGGGALTLLPRAVGRARAASWCSPGGSSTRPKPPSGDWSNRVVDDDALVAAGAELVASFAAKSPLAMANAKDVMMSLWADNGSVARACASNASATPTTASRRTTRPRDSPRSRRSARRSSAARERPRPGRPTPTASRFLAALRRHRFVLQHCSACGRVRFPPMPACPWCGGAVAEWRRVGTGRCTRGSACSARSHPASSPRCRTRSPRSISPRARACSAGSRDPNRARPAARWRRRSSTTTTGPSCAS